MLQQLMIIMSKHKTYNINPAKIGNQKGFRLPNAFYQDNLHLVDASGQIEVINDDTLLIHLDTKKMAGKYIFILYFLNNGKN
jgi:hypothetical protein